MSEDEAGDDEIIGEVEIIFSPRPEALSSRNISSEDFENALVLALEARQSLEDDEDLIDDDLPPLEEMELEINGATYKLEDLADIEFQGDLDLLSEDHDDPVE
jgi:hypothetical protein